MLITLHAQLMIINEVLCPNDQPSQVTEVTLLKQQECHGATIALPTFT